LRARTRLWARRTATIATGSAAFGAILSLSNGGDVATGVLAGVLIAVAIVGLELLLQGRWSATLRRWPIGRLLLLRTAAYGAVFFLVVHVLVALLSWSWDPILHPTRLISNLALALSFAFAFVMNFGLVLMRLLGPRVAVSLLSGRYRWPRPEQRIVLFMDLRGSTQLAERLGDERFHRFLNEVFWDLTDPVLESAGEIYRYIGDEIIVTWPVRRRARNGGCVECVFAIEDALAAKGNH
jgi:adenylate cyclase